MRKVGMLMPVASLPGRHGIGDFGKESYNFVDLLKEEGSYMADASAQSIGIREFTVSAIFILCG